VKKKRRERRRRRRVFGVGGKEKGGKRVIFYPAD
tara:strand:+ start:136 stop:237 length:102 start_codon:yes stop_codon:yes gene_type:complete